MIKTADVIIIGGGIIGLAIAYYLGKGKAKKVLLLEKDLLGEGATGRTVGGIRCQFSTEINIRFSIESRRIFEHFEEEFGVDPEFRQVGYLFLATNEEDWLGFRRNVELQSSLGVPSELLTSTEIKANWPYLRTDDVLGGAFCHTDGYAGPHEVVQGLLKGARRYGIKIQAKTEVIAIDVQRGRVTGVRTRAGRIDTPLIVNAAGPHASRIGRMVGLEIPVRPIRRQIFITDPFDGIPKEVPITIDHQRSWYFRREGRSVILAGPRDREPSFKTNTDFDSMVEAAQNATYRVPVLRKARIVRGWGGLYSISPDNHAILGNAPGVEGFILANGFSGHGFQHGPATGKVISELILEGRARTIDIAPLSLTRFKERKMMKESLTAFKG